MLVPIAVKFAPRFITIREYLSSSDLENEKSSMMEMKKELLFGWIQSTHSVLEVRKCNCSPTHMQFSVLMEMHLAVSPT